MRAQLAQQTQQEAANTQQVRSVANQGSMKARCVAYQTRARQMPIAMLYCMLLLTVPAKRCCFRCNVYNCYHMINCFNRCCIPVYPRFARLYSILHVGKGCGHRQLCRRCYYCTCCVHILPATKCMPSQYAPLIPSRCSWLGEVSKPSKLHLNQSKQKQGNFRLGRLCFQ